MESWCREITKRIRHGSFHSVAELKQAIEEYLEHNNRQPKPFVWTASVAKLFREDRSLQSYFRDTTLRSRPSVETEPGRSLY